MDNKDVGHDYAVAHIYVLTTLGMFDIEEDTRP